MVDLTTKTFISYKRQQKEVAEALGKSLHEHGLRTWRDLDDLRSGVTDVELQNVLRGNNVADAVVLVSEEVATSDPILENELPEIAEREAKDDDFTVVVALCPNLKNKDEKESSDGGQDCDECTSVDTNGNDEEGKSIYEKADEILEKADSIYNLTSWNMKKVCGDGTNPRNHDEIAEEILRSRLRRINQNFPDDEPVNCSLDTYEIKHELKPTIKIDWSHYFKDRHPDENVWNERLVPVLNDTVTIIRNIIPGRYLKFQGNAKLPAVFALGYLLQSTTGTNAAWIQNGKYSNKKEQWDLSINPIESDIDVVYTKGDISKADAAVMISINGDISSVSANKSGFPNFGPKLDLRWKEGDPNISPSEGYDIARKFRKNGRKMMEDHNKVETIHLMIAAPSGLAFLMGQLTNTLPDIQTYALDTSDGPRRYRRTALLSDKK